MADLPDRHPVPDGAGTPAPPWRRWLPGLTAIETYQPSWLRFDLVAGVVLAAILVPQGMAYAELAGLPAVTGLYTTIACLVAYAVFGPSRVLVLGPDSSVSPLILASITPLIVAGDPGSAIVLAGMLAVMVGLIEIGLGVAKLGFVADLLSSEVRVGYLNGLAVTIIVGQLPKLFGFSTDADGFVDELRAFVDGIGQRNAATLLTGIAVLVVLLVMPRVSTRVPAVLVAVVGVTIASAVFDLASHDVATVGVLPGGFPTPRLPWTDVSDAIALAVGAVGITMVSLTDTIATASSFAARRGDEVDPDAEMVGVGTANIAAGLFQGFAVSVSGSRTAVADQSGARTQLAGVVGAGLVALLLLAFNGLLADLPQAALAAVVIAAALSLVDVSSLARYWRVRRSALVVSLVASAGVILLGVLQGIVVAIVLAILLFFRRNWWPHGEVLREDHELGGWHDERSSPDGTEEPGMVVFRWEAPLFFANAGQFRDQIRALVRDRSPSFVVLQCEAITDIDVTAAEVLRDLDEELNAGGTHLAFVELRARLQDLVVRYGLDSTLDQEHFYPSIDVAVRDLRSEGADSDRAGVVDRSAGLATSLVEDDRLRYRRPMDDVTGPVDYLVLQLPNDQRDGSIAAALLDLVEANTVTILDLAVVTKDADGTVRGVDLNAVEGELTAFAGARSGLIGDDEQHDAGSVLEPGTTAAILVYENTWARPFVAAATDVGAQVLASARIPADVLMAAIDEIDAQED